MLALKTEPRAPAESDVAGIFANIASGLAYVRTNRELMAILAITMCFNLLGFPYVSLVPVIAREDLGLSPFPTGVLMSAEGLGALAGSLWVAFYARSGRFHQIYFVGTTVYFACVVVFALSPVLWLSLPTLLIAGVGMAGFATMQSALVMASAPPELRNRAMGVLTMCIGVAPVGIFAVGMLAERLGAAPAVLVSSSLGLAALIACGLIRPEMAKRREG
jgi:predicted MFS family arabinose efflux permease